MKTVVIENLFYLILTSYSHIKNRAREQKGEHFRKSSPFIF